MDFTGFTASPSSGELGQKEFNDAFGTCASTAETSPPVACSPRVANRMTSGLEESLSTLGRETESLVRNMRLDNVVLQSRNEHMKLVLRKLEEELSALENMTVCPSAIGDGEEEGKKECGTENFPEKPPNRLSTTSSDTIISSVDWAYLPPKETQMNDISRSKRKGTHDLSSLSKNNSVVGDDIAREGLDSFEMPNVIKAKSNKNILPLRRIFRWGDRATENDQQILSSSPGSTASESNSVSVTSVPYWNGKDKRWSSKNTQSKLYAGSILSVDHSINSSNLLQWLGDANRPSRRHTVQEAANNNLLHRMFQKNNVNCKDPHTNLDSNIDVAKKKKSTDCPASSNECKLNAGCPKLSDSDMTEKLHLKLRGCDLAKSSLQDLHTLHARSLLDLRRDYTLAQIDCDIEAHHIDRELEGLRIKLAYCQKENTRKKRLIKEARNQITKASDREEVLIEEVECVCTELFALNQELSKKGLLSNEKITYAVSVDHPSSV